MEVEKGEVVNVGLFKPVFPLSLAFMPLMLGFLTAIGPISTDIYLPALPALESDLHTNMSGGAWTMMVWVAGLAVGQISVGPIVDSWGRKIPLMCGALLYAVFSVLSAEAAGLLDFCAYRFFAAVAGAVSLVSPKACVRDLTSGNQTANFLSKLVLVQGVVPIVAPALGGAALTFISWRTLFLCMGVYGVIAFFLEWIFLPETLLIENRRAAGSNTFYPTAKIVWNDPTFKWCGLIWMAQGMTVFSYLAGAPDLFEGVYQLKPFQYGILFGTMSVGLIATSTLNILLLRFFTARAILKSGVIATFVTSILCCLIVIPTLLVPHWFISTFGRYGLYMNAAGCFLALLPGALVGPNSVACSLENQRRHAGMASAMGGCGVYIFGTVGSALVAVSPINPAFGMSLMFFLAAAFMVLCLGKVSKQLSEPLSKYKKEKEQGLAEAISPTETI